MSPLVMTKSNQLCLLKGLFIEMFREMFQGMCEQDVGRDMTRDGKHRCYISTVTVANYHDISAHLPYWKDQNLLINTC